MLNTQILCPQLNTTRCQALSLHEICFLRAILQGKNPQRGALLSVCYFSITFGCFCMHVAVSLERFKLLRLGFLTKLVSYGFLTKFQRALALCVSVYKL
jgi:hypothetical protein